jgi:cytochrome oxidase Cu insertion factor (SCO1/SenC/PrrC family)/thiol-disulfide isomerase/thioredoxin
VHEDHVTPRRPLWLLLALIVAGVVVVLALSLRGSSSPPPGATLAGNPYVDSGSSMGDRPAPDFTLTDQFGHAVSLRSFRGRAVLLAFNDSKCTTVCPLTTTAMVEARRMLGRAGSQLALLGVDANPGATSVHDVLSYSELHGMTHAWRFLTGRVGTLRRVWKAYGIGVEINRGQIDHTPALFLIDPRGRLSRVYLTQQSYAAVGQLAQVLARQTAQVLPGHPRVHSRIGLAPINGITPAQATTLPGRGGRRLTLGPASGDRLYVFFATWDREVTPLDRDLVGLNAYVRLATARHLPPLAAVDEASVEPSPEALPRFLRTLRRPLGFPLALDVSGRVADGYEVEDQPWFVLTSAAGRILWYLDASTAGWPTIRELVSRVHAALARAPRGPATAAAATRALAGSPPALAALHGQAAQLISGHGRLAAAVRALRGYPVVVNAWASSCAPCQAEFGLLASASARYGRQVAFLGADTNDQAGDARAFLAHHYVSYPSYAATTSGLEAFLPGGLQGLPTTFFLDRHGKLVYAHDGEYVTQGTLDQDIRTYALGP